MEPLEIVILIVGLAIIVYTQITKFPSASEFWAGSEIFISKWAILIYLIIFIFTFLHYNKKRHYRKFKEALDKQEEKERIESLIYELEQLLDENIEYMDPQEMKDHRAKLEEANKTVEHEGLNEIEERIDKKIEVIDREYPVRLKEEKISSMKRQEKELQSALFDLKWRVAEKKRELDEKEKASLEKLDPDNNPVYFDEDLTENERTLLKKHGYKRTSEYCVDQKKLISVLVKPAMRHSVTHTFLVWSVQQMLHRIKGVTDIQTKDTREADIAFKFRRMWHAIEVETGTLLSKKYQLRAKAANLTEKYGERWIILVSKKSLMPKYRGYGKVTSRSELETKLKKLLKFASPSKEGVSVIPRRGKG